MTPIRLTWCRNPGLRCTTPPTWNPAGSRQASTRPTFRRTQEPGRDWWLEVCEGEGVIHGGHSHLTDPDELRKDIATYYGMVSFMDEHIGRILEALDRLGLAENTLVVFTTDHGHFLGQHGLMAKAIHMYEDLIRIPWIVRWPGRVPAGCVSVTLQNLVDLAPTFLAAAGVEIPGRMTGLNLLPDWCDGRPVRAWSITENHNGRRRFHMRTFVNSRYKLTIYRQGSDGEFFDLERDPSETRNLWSDRASQTAKAQVMDAFLRATLQTEPERMPRIAGA